MNMDEFAKNLSHKLHATQKRNDGVTPYILHTDYVSVNSVKYLDKFLESPSETEQQMVRAIGSLHDSLEDYKFTNINADQLYELGVDEYPLWGYVVDNVLWLSRFSKEDNIIEYLSKIKASPLARAVKLADLEHNMSNLGPGNLRDKYQLCWEYLK